MEKFYVTDTSLSARFPIYTRGNVGEVFPDPVTPLTSGTTLWFAELGWQDTWVRIGAFGPEEFPEGEFSQLGVLGGYCYLNASLVRIFGERGPGLSWEIMDNAIFGVQPGVPPYAEMDGDVRPEATAKMGETFGYVLSQSRIEDLTELMEDRATTVELRRSRPDLTSLTDAELVERYLTLAAAHRHLFAHHIFVTFLATLPVGIISGVATAVGRPDLILPIIAGIGDVDSAAPSYAMWELSRLDPASPEFTAGFEAFLYEFGSRGPNEWETRSPTWETRPALALSAIDRMRAAPDSMAPVGQNAIRAAQREAASAELLAIVEGDPAVHGQLQAGINSSKAWLPGRERTKTNNIRHIHEMRVSMRELGRRMVERGVFDEVEDFGFVTKEELDTLVNDPASLTDVIRVRRAEYAALQELTPPFVVVGSDEGPSTWTRRDAHRVDQLSSGATLQGMPGCGGFAEGTARVILDSNDPSALEPGDILVAPITDPSWTPLFVPAAAVVVDVGAVMSHAIIVSRELGIPCVVSATDATRRIPNGARIRVDGDTGIITIL